ncbi:Variant-specific surface protein [Giardia duodenalis]|uniref:Variant-specific surface protein n=1 Tax=Giardia intestinalis TaxID=5741 RepID=V6TZX0_GIAIN|nr:Variant-specific surface protein [Giardia intestinalis]
MLNKFILVAVILQIAWTEQVVEKTGAVSKECTEGQSGDAGKCASGKCVTIGADKICSQCAKTADEAPLNGVCQVPSDANICKTKAGGKCTECAGQSFMYQGGCYEQSDAFGQTICTALDAGTAGVCKTCAAGYFKNPANVATSDSCIACGDATGVTVSGGATYKGVDGCTACDGSALKAGTNGVAKCTACTSGKKPNAAGSSCYTCPDEGATAGCSSCSADNTCEACVPGKILKTSGSTKTCVAEAECTAGFFVSTTNSVKTCVSCGATPNGVSGCAECQPSTQGSAYARCTKCSNSVQKPSEDGRQCNNCNVDGCVNCNAENQCAVCGDGYRKNGDTCQKCTPEHCKACTNDAKICTACAEGYTLEGGKCASSSANKSGLSTGAIAGISVAAVVVVGGLVGFLCWWFICRGKA